MYFKRQESKISFTVSFLELQDYKQNVFARVSLSDKYYNSYTQSQWVFSTTDVYSTLERTNNMVNMMDVYVFIS